MNLAYRYAKRGIDIMVAGVGIMILLPVWGTVALVIALTMGFPVLFRQERAGLDGQPFILLKFRTMRADRSRRWDPSTDAVRLTSVGRVLRRWSLDELPQLLNVLAGEMSLVGPRPLPLRYLDRYNSSQRRRLDAVPGITGWAQINGRNTTSWQRRFELDEWYVEHRSLGLDLKILALTGWSVISGAGVSQEGAATMTEFMGE
ncbi:MAG: sugar transferase [Gemmatimonadetes bacterium]|nr:sugar transferase [Gemmatimonadota bacterium]